MGVKGRRKILLKDEPTSLKDVESVLNMAREQGFINHYEVDIEEIVKSHDELILEKDPNMEASMSGSLSKNKISNKWVIKINAKHHIKRQRFTMAHEFAHYILHKDDQGKFVDEEIYFRKDHDSPIEYNADLFAAKLLMPEDLFRQAINEDGVKKISELSELFNISKAAIAIRAEKLGFKTTAHEK